jgi:pantothenate kinase
MRIALPYQTMEMPVTRLQETARDLADRMMSLYRGQRLMLAIAGAPGSGKSIVADDVVEEINRRSPSLSAVFPMDGFHFDDAVLTDMGRLQNKGAIDTFDVHGLRHTLARLKANEDDVVAVPVFDRSIEIARAGGRLIGKQTGIIVCEGNYLLMRQEPWDRLKPLFDLTVLVEVEIEELRRRLRARWESLGLDEEVVRRKVEGNDLPNGIAIMAGSAEPDLRVRN